MTIDEIKALDGVAVEEQEKYIVVRATDGYALQVETPTPDPSLSEGSEDADTLAATPVVTDCVYLPPGREDYPDLSVVASEASDADGTRTAGEDGEGGTLLTVAQRLAALEARVSALEADAAQAGGEGDGESGIMAADADEP